MSEVHLSGPPSAPVAAGIVRLAVRIVMPLAIIGLAVGIAVFLIRTRPKAERSPRRPMTAIVRVVPVAAGTERVLLHAQGTVIPARQITLKSRVPGEIIDVDESFVDGGLVQAGDDLVRIDPLDYELAVARSESLLATAEFESHLEYGRQEVAQREWELLDARDTASDRERSLALREPHRKQVDASLKSAQAEVKQARLNLERTSVRAPYSGVILQRYAELGARVGVQDPLAILTGTDEYWIRVALPADRLPWLSLPTPSQPAGAVVRVESTSGTGTWTGRVVRLLGDLEQRGRMARLIVGVTDPMGLKRTEPGVPLLLGSYVGVEIEGRSLDRVIRVPRAALRDNTSVWVAMPDETLDIREVDVAWRGSDSVLLKNGLKDGDRLVISDIPAPIQGMKLRVAGDED